MKMRQGFVSNSSSSSFILITTKKNHERAMKVLHPQVQFVMSKLVKPGPSFLGKETVFFHDMSNCNGEAVSDYEIERGESYEGEELVNKTYDEPLCTYELIELYEAEVKKNPDEVFTNSVYDG